MRVLKIALAVALVAVSSTPEAPASPAVPAVTPDGSLATRGSESCISIRAPVNLDSYLARGFGYSRALEPIGRMTFVFDRPEQAAHDLIGRGKLAAAKRVGGKHETYAESVFNVVRARTDDRPSIFDVGPINEAPISYMLSVSSRGMLSAVCGS